ncbi:hypothetical protein ACQ4PT_056279 [Festuca glaucescens]
MANEWRKLALTVPETLLEASASYEAIRLIDFATIKLKAQHEALRSYRVGVAGGYVEPGPASLLEGARRDIKRCSALHGLADSALPLCFEGLGLVLGGEMVQSWAGHSSDALRNADEAQTSLRNGVSLATAAIDDVGMAAALPEGVDLQRAWLLAAEQLQNKAINEVCLARNHLREMRGEISLQFIDAGSIVHILD